MICSSCKMIWSRNVGPQPLKRFGFDLLFIYVVIGESYHRSLLIFHPWSNKTFWGFTCQCLSWQCTSLSSTLYWNLMTLTFVSYNIYSSTAARALDVLNFTPLNNKPIRIMYSHRDPSIRKSGMANIFIKVFTFMLTALFDFFFSFKAADCYFFSVWNYFFHYARK